MAVDSDGHFAKSLTHFKGMNLDQVIVLCI